MNGGTHDPDRLDDRPSLVDPGPDLRLIAGPGQHSDLRHAAALASGVPALDRGYISAPLRAAFAADGCTVHTPPKRGLATMINLRLAQFGHGA